MTMHNSNTIELTPAILRTLAEGIRSLHDGDLEDLRVASEVEATLARAGHIVVSGRTYPASEATHGYVRGQYTYQTFGGEWAHGEPGDVLTLDAEGTIPLRTI